MFLFLNLNFNLTEIYVKLLKLLEKNVMSYKKCMCPKI